MSEVKVGDRVRAIRDDRDRRLEGKIGTVVEVEGFCVGVDFDSEIDGHTCGGLAHMVFTRLLSGVCRTLQ